jgi:hypothetical protein
VLQGNIRALLAAKDHVNIFLCDGAIVPIKSESSPPGTTPRPPSAPCASRLLANNSASGWRKLKSDR